MSKKKFTNEEEFLISQRYTSGELSRNQIALEYKISRATATKILTRCNIDINRDNSELNRIYTLNESYFDVIDTEEKAYFLGLLYADGCNSLNRNMVRLCLQEPDKEILEKFNLLLDSNKSIGVEQPSKSYPKYQKQKMCVLYMTSKQIAQNLTNLGCVPQKTLKLEFPSEVLVPKILQRHLIRGYMDGDGYFSVGYRSKTGYLNLACGMTSTYMFLSKIKDILLEELDIKSSYIPDKSFSTDITQIFRISGTQQIFKFLRWLYDDSTIYLKRKHDKYLLVLDALSKYGFKPLEY